MPHKNSRPSRNSTVSTLLEVVKFLDKMIDRVQAVPTDQNTLNFLQERHDVWQSGVFDLLILIERHLNRKKK